MKIHCGLLEAHATGVYVGERRGLALFVHGKDGGDAGRDGHPVQVAQVDLPDPGVIFFYGEERIADFLGRIAGAQEELVAVERIARFEARGLFVGDSEHFGAGAVEQLGVADAGRAVQHLEQAVGEEAVGAVFVGFLATVAGGQVELFGVGHGQG